MKPARAAMAPRALQSQLALALLFGPLIGLASCVKDSPRVCKESGQQMASPLSKAPKNGAQYGGMTIDSSGVSSGSGAPKAAADAGDGLLRIYVVLANPGGGLSDAQKSALSGTLGDVKNNGIQAFVRFYYQNALTSKANAADTVSKIKSDIAAAKPILSQYVDLMPFVQAGFLGPWGEWWDGDLEGSDFGSDQDLRTLKTGVVDALKAAFPSTFIQMRYPRDIATYYADDPQISFHDDSVLAGDDDGGTFNATKKCALWPDGDPGKQRAWLKQRSAKFSSVNAGESSEVTPDVSCSDLLAYLAEYRILVFNTQWPAVVTKCAGQLKSGLSWNGPLGPTAPTGGSGGNGGTSSVDPNFGTELGCWATDQRPWQLCNPAGCPDGRCRRAAADAECTMYRASQCTGSWPPPGYPGEEMVPTGGTGSGGTGNGGSGTPPNGGNSASSGAPSGAAGTAPSGTGGSANGSGGSASANGGTAPGAAASSGTTPPTQDAGPDGGC